MQINQNNSSTNFKSFLIPNRNLKMAFENAKMKSDRTFLKSVEFLMNDEKPDVIELVSGPGSKMSLYVNEKKVDEEMVSYYNNAGVTLINKFAGNIIKNKQPNEFKYSYLSHDEKNIISENVQNIKLCLDQLSSSTYMIFNIQNEISKMKLKLEEHTKKELKNLWTKILNQ